MTQYRKKLIEVSLPLEAINVASAREKSIRHGHPSTLHLWWARRPLAAARAVIFAQLVDDPASDPDLLAYPAAEREHAISTARENLHALITELVQWESTTNEAVLDKARAEIARSIALDKLDSGEMTKETVFHDAKPLTPRGFGDEAKTTLWDLRRRAARPEAVRHFLAHHAPGFHDPFAGGGALPLEAQRLGLTSYASDLNPVAVLINKAMIEIPPKFAGQPPVNPDARKAMQAATGKGKQGKEFAAYTTREWKGAQGLAEDVRCYGQWMRDEAEKRIGHLYPKVEVTAEMAKERPDLKPYVGRKLTVIAWLWARTVKSPNPAYSHVDVPLASTFMLSTKPGKEAYVEPVIEGDKYRFTVKVGKPRNAEAAKNGTKIARANFGCLLSKAPVSGDYIKAEGKVKRMGARLMAIVAEGDRGRVYLAPTPEHEATALKAKPTWKPEGDIATRMTGGNCTPYGLTTWGDLFTARQLVALTTFSDLVQEARERIKQDAAQAFAAHDSSAVASAKADNRPLSEGGTGPQAYADAVAVYMSFALSKVANIGSTIASWMSDRGAFRETFARQAIPMVWDFAEANSFADAGGSLGTALTKGAMAIDFLPVHFAGTAAQLDASTQAITQSKVVSTDPPYYDNIGYADLSDFFYAWLRRALQPVFPGLFATVAVPKAEELVATPYRHGSKDKAEKFFLNGMTHAMHRLAEQAYRGAPVTIYYAFKQSETTGEEGTASTGWETFIAAVIEAGFGISGTWPMRTEGAGRMTAMGTNALASSIVLVCRPRPADAPMATRREFVAALKSELPEALRNLQAGNIAPVDLAQAAIGPGMAVYTRYSKVVDAQGEPVRVRDALALINETLDESLAEQEGDFDADTRWALAWFEHAGFDEGEFGVAETLSKAKVTSIGGLVEAGIVASARGKVRLLRPDELPENWDPQKDDRLTVWETVHHLVRRLEKGGETAAAELVKKLGSVAEVARELAYRLYTLCERKKRAQEALSYNALVQSWPEITRLAKEGGKTPERQRSILKADEGED